MNHVPDMTLTVTPQEAQAILQVLGQLPTSSGAFPLMQKIEEQVRRQSFQYPQQPAGV